ncbi:MAG: hypothetical protein JNK41_00295 [Saprospiraceae bacterium]|nr:hypothetical protein [Saprospiraceae bacterium]
MHTGPTYVRIYNTSAFSRLQSGEGPDRGMRQNNTTTLSCHANNTIPTPQKVIE